MAGEVDNPDDADLLELAIRSIVAQIHTSIPGRVLSYAHTTSPRATVRPVVRFSFIDPDTEERVPYLPEAVANVPVLFPSSADHSDTWPLVAGDPVWLLVAERSIDEWLATDGGDNTPRDPRRFDLTDAVALPVLGAGALPADAVDPTARVLRSALLKLGSASAVDFVALASLVAGELTTIASLFALVDTQLKALAQPGLGVPPVYVPGSVAATKVQAE